MSATAIRIGAATVFAVATLGVLRAAPASPDAQATLARGIEALHYFEYEEANEAFRAAHRLNGEQVMACWGEAMTFHQTLWRNEDVQQARAALAGCGQSPESRAAKASSPKERMFLGSADALFGDGDCAVRRQRYADAMAAL